MSCCDLHVNAKRRPDPSRTVGIQKRFEADAYKRFNRLKGLINKAIVEGDGFGLKGSALSRLMINRGEFEFTRTDQKVSAFMRWLRSEVEAVVLGVSYGQEIASAGNDAWTSTYISSAYTQGVAKSASLLRKGGANVQDSWIQGAFRREIHADRAALAYTRTFNELEGITRVMDQQISRELALGLAEGQSPFEIARRINNRVDKIGVTRARMLARTEVISAHADATLNSFEEAGIEGVDVEAEWLTAFGACPICENLSSQGPYKLSEARGMIPAHPNCRCSWSPIVVNGTGITLV